MKEFPIISVVMAVKNGADYIEDSINSILNQTYKNFELIIINDGSDDQTLEIVSGFQDPRIKIFSQSNRGVARSANRGLALAQGKYVARQDHDDFSKPERFELQVEYLNRHPEIALVGSAAEIWEGSEPTNRFLSHPENSGELKLELMFNNPFVHSSIMFRREIIKTVGLYNPSPQITPLDDYDFISRVGFSYEIANLKEALIIYRETPKSLTSGLRSIVKNKSSQLINKLIFVSSANISRYNNYQADKSDCRALTIILNHIENDLNLRSILKAKKLLRDTITLNSTQFAQAGKSLDAILRDKMDMFEYHVLTLKLEKHKSIPEKIHLFFVAIHYLAVSFRRRQLFNHYQRIIVNKSSKTYWQIREFCYHKLLFKKAIKAYKSLFK